MKLLPININDRHDYLIDFESERKVQDSFIIKVNESGSIFDFYDNFYADYSINIHGVNKSKLGIILLSGSDDKFLYIEKIVFTNKQSDYIVSIKLCEEEKPLNVINNTGQINYENFSLRYNDIQTPTSVFVTFEYENITKGVKFHLAPSNNIWKAVVDSGSEATQIKVFNPGGNGERIKLLSYILGTRKFNDEDIYRLQNDNIGIIQAEGEANSLNYTLYKSIYYVKKNISNSDIAPETIIPAVRIQNFKDPLRMVTLTSDFEDSNFKTNYTKLANLKIASFGNVEQPSVKVEGNDIAVSDVGNNYYYKKYMGEFCYHILNYIKTAEGENFTPKFLSLYVLVPNVYSTHKIQKNIDSIIEALDYILVHKVNNFDELIKGFSVTAVSESDASLIGSIEKLEKNSELNLNDRNCLILDAGKGTLDFSVVHIDKKGGFENILRNGIIGASAAINYGFILDLLTAYYAPTGVTLSKEHLAEIINSGIIGNIDNERTAVGAGDVALLNKLMNAVDNYKIKYDSYNEEIVTTNSVGVNAGDDSFSLEAFVEWIKKNKYKVPNRYVRGIINEIVKNTLEKINNSKDENTGIDYVLYAGRGFLYKELKKEMNNALLKVYKNIEEIECAENNTNLLKTMCLNISSAIDSGRYDTYSISRVPQITQEDSNITKKETSDNKKSIISKLLGSFVLTSKAASKKNELRKKYKITEIDAVKNGYIQIGATHYNLGNIAEGKASLFISGDNIYIRDNKGVVITLSESANNIESSNLTYPSLFPDVKNNLYIYIPEAEGLNNYKKTTVPVEKKDNNVTVPVEKKDNNATVPVEKKDNNATVPVEKKDNNATVPVEKKDNNATVPVEKKNNNVTVPVEKKDNNATVPVEKKDNNVTVPVEKRDDVISDLDNIFGNK